MDHLHTAPPVIFEFEVAVLPGKWRVEYAACKGGPEEGEINKKCTQN